MKICVVWAGRTRDAHMRALVEEYAKRSRRFFPLDVLEVRSSSRERDPEVARREEGKKMLATFPQRGYVNALDPGGLSMTTAEFAAWLARGRDGGARALVFAVGGEHGLHRDVLKRADMRMALTPMTLPHEMARLLLMEQIYRAGALLAGHPYPR
jgi:23S rRNA (pseudouridine1915-N3)-methyltransferase